MDKSQLKESWEITTSHLMKGRSLLPDAFFFEEANTFEQYFLESLEANELAEAMYSLDGLGLLCNAPDELWKHLELAAINMGLLNEAEQYKKLWSA